MLEVNQDRESEANLAERTGWGLAKRIQTFLPRPTVALFPKCTSPLLL